MRAIKQEPAVTPGPDRKKRVWLSPEDLIEYWGGIVTKQTLAGWRNGIGDGGPSFGKLGGRVYYDLEDVIAYEERGRVCRDRKAAGK